MNWDDIVDEKTLDKFRKYVVRTPQIYAGVVRLRANLPASHSKIVPKEIQLLMAEGKRKTPTNPELLMLYHEQIADGTVGHNPKVEQLLKRLKVRSNSGVAVISLLTKPYACPGRCIYCPTEKNMPKSYLSKEPAAARALANRFDPYKQIWSRLSALSINGHPVDKVEMIMIGGTWNYYPREYQEEFVIEAFRACNNWGRDEAQHIAHGELGLIELQKINETATARIIGLSIETRPDYVSLSELNWLRYLGVTKVEIGVQHLDNAVLELNKREMTAEAIAEASDVLRRAGFKIVYHMMPNLPGSNPEMDVAMFRGLFDGKDHHPDMLKIYPCMILKGSVLYKWWTRGQIEYVPYDDTTLTEVLADAEREIPSYVRLIRVIRDIPADYIYASSRKSNLRELVDEYQRKRGVRQVDIRAREIRDAEVELRDFELTDTIYETQSSFEHFIQFENKEKNTLAGFCRLRLPTVRTDFSGLPHLEVLANAAVIRELHVYGTMKKIGEGGDQSQHVGFGRRLVNEAERIAKSAGYTKIAVISGVGVRGYYEMLGYRLEGTYMVKSL